MSLPLPALVMVTGTMRSGTTLLGELLYASAYGRPCHPELSFANDSFEILRSLLYKTRELANPHWGIGHPLGRLHAPNSLLEQTLSTLEQRPIPPGGVGEDLTQGILALAPIPGQPRVIGTKSTDIYGEFDLIRTQFPRSRLLVTVRDPRDVLASNVIRVGRNKPLDGMTVVTSICNLYHFLKNRRQDPDILMIRYEDLVADPQPHIEKILAFLDLDPTTYDWSALTEKRVAANSSYSDAPKADFVLGRGVSKQSIGRFRAILSPFEVWAVERLLKEHMADHGYPLAARQEAGFEAEFLDHWLPFLHAQSQRISLSLEGLWLQMAGLGFASCREELELGMELGRQMLLGHAASQKECRVLLARSRPRAPNRRGSREILDQALLLAKAKEWPAFEEAMARAVCGVEGEERLFLIGHNFLQLEEAGDALHDYMTWRLTFPGNQWPRLILPKRITLRQSRKDLLGAEEDFLRLMAFWDNLIVQYPEDMSYRINKMEHQRRFGAKLREISIREDLEAVRRALAEGSLPGALVARAEKIVGIHGK